MPWTGEDKEWIAVVSNLLDAILGPDHFEFEQTADTKYCVVGAPVSTQV